MATLRIKISNGEFVSHNGVNVEEFSAKHVIGNGWECYLDEKGDFTCFSNEIISDVRYKMKFYVRHGFVKTLLKIGESRPTLLRSYKADEWSTDGTIGLPTGQINERRPYFRNERFQRFLDEYGITAVRRDTPCDVFLLERKTINSEIVIDEEIYTDGEIETERDWISYSNQFTTVENWQVRVKNATWVVVETIFKGVKKNKILTTLENPKEIVNLPKD